MALPSHANDREFEVHAQIPFIALFMEAIELIDLLVPLFVFAIIASRILIGGLKDSFSL